MCMHAHFLFLGLFFFLPLGSVDYDLPIVEPWICR